MTQRYFTEADGAAGELQYEWDGVIGMSEDLRYIVHRGGYRRTAIYCPVWGGSGGYQEKSDIFSRVGWGRRGVRITVIYCPDWGGHRGGVRRTAIYSPE